MSYVLFRYLHLIVAIVLVGGIIIENMATRPQINSEDAHNLSRVDAICGLSVLLLLFFGLILWVGVGKPADFYSANPVFHAKLGLFALLVIIATYPAMFFFKHRNFIGEVLKVPTAVRVCLRLEIAIVVLIPVLAWLMARGVGLSS